jgi:hypothetical protein
VIWACAAPARANRVAAGISFFSIMVCSFK